MKTAGLNEPCGFESRCIGKLMYGEIGRHGGVVLKFFPKIALVVELKDTPDLGSGAK